MAYLCHIFYLQLQLWLDNPKVQLTFENALPQIEAPFNSKLLRKYRIQGFLFGVKVIGHKVLKTFTENTRYYSECTKKARYYSECTKKTRYYSECTKKTRYYSECTKKTRYYSECTKKTRYYSECTDSKIHNSLSTETTWVLNSNFFFFSHWFLVVTFSFLILSKCICYESCIRDLAPTSSKGLNIQVFFSRCIDKRCA